MENAVVAAPKTSMRQPQKRRLSSEDHPPELRRQSSISQCVNLLHSCVVDVPSTLRHISSPLMSCLNTTPSLRYVKPSWWGQSSTKTCNQFLQLSPGALPKRFATAQSTPASSTGASTTLLFQLCSSYMDLVSSWGSSHKPARFQRSPHHSSKLKWH